MSKQIFKSLYTNRYVNNFNVVIVNEDYENEPYYMELIGKFILHEPDFDVIPVLQKVSEYGKDESINLYLLLKQLAQDIPYIRAILTPQNVSICFQEILTMLYSNKTFAFRYTNQLLKDEKVTPLIEQKQIPRSNTARGKNVYRKKIIEPIEYVNENIVRVNTENGRIIVPNVHNQNYDIFYFMVDVLGVDKIRLSSYELKHNITDYIIHILNLYPTLFNNYTFNDIQYLKEQGLYATAVIAEYFKLFSIQEKGNSITIIPTITAIGSSSLMSKELYNLGIVDNENTVHIIHDKLLNRETVQSYFINTSDFDVYDENGNEMMVMGYYNTNIESKWVLGIIDIMNNSYNSDYIKTYPQEDLGHIYWKLIDIHFEETKSFNDLVVFLENEVKYYSFFYTDDDVYDLQQLMDTYEDKIIKGKMGTINDEQAREIFAMTTTLTNEEYDTDIKLIMKTADLLLKNNYEYEAAILDSYIRTKLEEE